jgi:hypothetical protein
VLARLLRRGSAPRHVSLNVLILVALLAPDTPTGFLLGAATRPVMALDLFLFLRGVGLVLHVLLQSERFCNVAY